MNWIKENKFLFGFLVVMVLGVGAGGWFILEAKGRSDAATEDYERKIAELSRLQRLAIFPNQKNLDRIVAQQTDVNAEVSKLAKTLATQQIPLEQVSPEQFQDKLKAAVTAVKSKAAQTNPAVKLPEPKFFLGFDPYETAPPPKEAAGVLARELKAIEWLCNQLIDNKITELKPLNREPLPEEKGKTKETTPVSAGKPAAGKPGDKAKAGGVRYEIEKHRIDLAFVTEQSRFRDLLNAIVSHKGQFFIPRLINVKNEKPVPPPRVAEVAAVPPAPADPAAPAGTAPAAPATPAAQAGYIVGEEKIEVTLVLDLVDIREGGTK